MGATRTGAGAGAVGSTGAAEDDASAVAAPTWSDRMMTVWTFFGAVEDAAGGGDPASAAGPGAPGWTDAAGGQIDAAGAVGITFACGAVGAGGAAATGPEGAGNAGAAEAKPARCAEFGTPAWPEFGSGKIGTVETTRGVWFAGTGTSTGCSSRGTSFSPEGEFASA
jgi:hypothetical protein